MDKTEMLFVRACKSVNPRKRVQSVYSRFYYRCEPRLRDSYIANILVNICEKFNIMSLSDIITAMHPSNKWKYINEDDAYWTAIMNITTSHICLSHVNKFPGLIAPTRFKRGILVS